MTDILWLRGRCVKFACRLLFTWSIAAGTQAVTPALQCNHSHPSLDAATLVSALPVETFFAARGERWDFRVSPDGQTLLWMTLKDGISMPQFRPLRGGPVTTIRSNKPINWAYWASDSRHLILWRDQFGDENYRPWSVDTWTPDDAARELVSGTDVRAFYQQQFSSPSTDLMVRHNGRDRSVMDLYRIELRTARQRLVARNPGDVDLWVTDRHGVPILRRHRHADFSWHIETLGKEHKVLMTGSADEYFEPRGNPPAGTDWLWALSNRGRDRTALVKLDLATGLETVVYEHPSVDVDGAWIDERLYEPLAAWSWPGHKQVKGFGTIVTEALASVAPWSPASVEFTSWSDDKRVMILRLDEATAGQRSFLYRRNSDNLVELGRTSLAKHRDKLADTLPISFNARDGLSLHGYLTLPRGQHLGSLPTILTVHGGPFSRDRWGYHALDQFLANRGYAVVRINYRGSTGYGRSFTESAKREFAGKMHLDLIDAVNWLVAQGISDPEKIAIHGRSFGGYAALVGLTLTPRVFAAGIDVMGPANLSGVIAAGPAYWSLYRALWYRFIGDPQKSEDRVDMASRSPINHLDKIERPLLVVHGANDVRISRDQSDLVVKSLRERGQDVEYLLFEGEGHSLRAWNSQLRLAVTLEAFLGKHLKGRVCSSAAETQ